MNQRPSLDQAGLSAGKKARLHRILSGLIFGRNVWQREHTESLRFVSQLKDILAKYPSG